MITLRHPDDITLKTLEAVAYEGQPLALDHALLDTVRRSHEAMRAALANGERVYSINTGTGFLAARDLSESEQTSHQRNLLLGRAVGSPPFLSTEEVRALLVVRLVNFLSGYSGVSPELCRFVVDRLNDEFTPAVPRTGIGASGEVIPLSHAFQTFLGVGSVMNADGTVQDAASALEKRGVAPYEPAPKEGIALLAGSPGTVAISIARLRAAATLSEQLLISAACAIHAVRAPLSVYGDHVERLGNDDVLSDVLSRLRDLLRGSTAKQSSLQAPVSFRVAPQVITHVERTISRFADDIERSLGAVSDSPAFVDGRFVSTGGFHEVELAAGMDMCATALIRTAELSAQRIHRMLDSRFSGLPDQLTSLPGPQAGLILVHKRAVGVVNELRRLAMPASVGLADTSLGQEDAMTFAFEAAEKSRRVESLVRDVIACELLVARQAWALRGEEIPEGLRSVAQSVIDAVDPVNEDRPLGPDITRLIGMLERGEFAMMVEVGDRHG